MDFKHLKKLQNDVLSFHIRWYKERGDIVGMISNTNKYFKLDKYIVNDLIDLIIYYGEIDIETLIYDYNLSNKKRIKSKGELINDILDVYNVWQMLTTPINYLFIWIGTTKGFDFYSNLNQIIIRNLKLQNLFQFFVDKNCF